MEVKRDWYLTLTEETAERMTHEANRGDNSPRKGGATTQPQASSHIDLGAQGGT